MVRKTKRDLADEAYVRSTANLPVGTEHAVGQIDAFTGTEAPPDTGLTIIPGIPDDCPECGRRQTLKSGWAALARFPAVQCGSCGKILAVTREGHAMLVAALKQYRESFALNNPKPAAKPKRPRGGR